MGYNSLSIFSSSSEISLNSSAAPWAEHQSGMSPW